LKPTHRDTNTPPSADELDIFIVDAAPVVPDCESNRLVTGAVLRERVRQEVKRRQQRFRRRAIIVLAAIVVSFLGFQILPSRGEHPTNRTPIPNTVNGQSFIEGFSFHGNVPYWKMSVAKTTANRTDTTSLAIRSISIPRGQITLTEMAFFDREYQTLLALIKTHQLAGSSYGNITANGISFAVEQWHREFPGWGEVAYYRGIPLR